MKALAYITLSALLALTACQDKSEAGAVVSPNPTAGESAGNLTAAGFARVSVSGRSDSVNALVVECDSASKAHGAKIKVGGTELPTRNGKFLLPIPELDQFCGAQITFTVTTTKGTFTDTLKIKGYACDDTTGRHIPAPAKDSSIVFDFQDTGAIFHDLSGRFPAMVNGTTWKKDESGFYLHSSGTSTVNFGELIKDGAKEGSVTIRFRPDANFANSRDTAARTIFGNNGSRCHIGWVKGQLFFQKGHDNIHRFIASDTGMMRESKWHTIQATWGAQGMTLSLDEKLIAWSNDISAYHAAPASYGNDLMIGGKTACCLEPQQISQYSPDLTTSGSYRLVKISQKQPVIWSDNTAHACKELPGLTSPSCGVTSPSYVAFPIW